MADAIAELEDGLLQLGRHFSSLRGRSRRRAGVLDQSAYTILTCLSHRRQMSYCDLREALGLDLSTLNRQVRSLIRAGYAQKVTPQPKGQPARFEMTGTGAALWQEEQQMTLSAMAGLLADWTPDEVQGFARALRRFNASIESQTGLIWPGQADSPVPDHINNA